MIESSWPLLFLALSAPSTPLLCPSVCWEAREMESEGASAVSARREKKS